ncbi:hypothetical protein [Planococcus halocryophilus]|uniref:hypothetical protein n=1 Tax=Planococcus halocryophilus TaxID=1215089 RepID=UPI001F0D09BB|nr:hypothetical protein [Planococcus halocryophilus]MCH4828056.1 hypothetical protein [Planococcus halocryophilus]
MDIVPHVKELLGLEEDSNLDIVANMLLDQAPTIVNAIQIYKISKLSKRMKLN